MSWLNPNPSNFKSEQPDEDDIDLIDLEEDDENVEISDKENTEGNMFNCDMCNQNYRNKSDFMNHFEVVHQIAKPRINNDELCDVKPKKNRKRRHQEPTENKENEDHNVGSLLRSVYSLEQNEYHANHQPRHVHQHSVVPDLMDCYQPPILDGISALDYL